MATEPALAFIRSAESLDRLPAGCRVLPLRPGLPLPEDRRLADRPERLLAPDDLARVDRLSRSIFTGWRSLLPQDALSWHGVDLGVCFSYEVGLVGLDLAKTLVVLEKALEIVKPRQLLTDASATPSAFPPYPYLSGLGSVAQAVAEKEGFRFEAIRPATVPASPASPRGAARAYGALAGRRGAARLKKGPFVAAVGPHPDFYRPLARAWRAEGRAVMVLAPSRSPVRSSSKEGLFLANAGSLLAGEERDAVRAFVTAATRRLADAAADLPAPIVAPLRAHLAARLNEWLGDIGELGAGFERGLERATGMILLETASPFARAAAEYARKAGVPRTVLQHGVIAEAFSYRLLEADRVAAWGPLDAEWFRRELPPRTRIMATGSPRYDGVHPDAAGMTEDPLPEVPASVPVVLFASQPFVQGRADASPWDRTALIDIVVETMRRGRGYRIVRKRHPAEEPDGLLPAEDEALAQRVHRRDTLALIRRCSVVLAVSSTVALEAMYLGRPVVFLGPPIPESPFRPPEDAAGLRAQSAEDLGRILGSLVSDTEYRGKVLAGQAAYLGRNYAPLDGHAAERVVALMKAG